MTLCNTQRQAGSSLLALTILLFLALPGQHARSQGQSEAPSVLESVLDQHDESGVLKTSSLNIDGSLTVSNSNGGVSYILPISSFTVDNYPINTTLTYNGDMAFTSYKQYLNSSGTDDRWDKLTMSRPAWIVGLNGFAVQVLSTTTDFTNGCCDNFPQNEQLAYDESDVIWLADGYDVCNRMDNMVATDEQDVIRLLRADGSLLELRNTVTRRDHNLPSDIVNAEELYTGYYYEKGVNSNGYATVEINQPEWQALLSRVGELRFTKTGNAPKTITADQVYFAPRIVRYFPGDGLEYVFREVVMPYGLDNSLWGFAALHGAAPTIFYLDEIRGATGSLTGLRYSRQQTNFPVSSGRATIQSFAGHSFSYQGSGLIINALGREFRLRWGAVGSGDAFDDEPELEYREMPIVANGLNGIDEISTVESFAGMLRRITDPAGRTIDFGYERYDRQYRNWGFPRVKPQNADIDLTLSAFRLTSVQRGAAIQEISYMEPEFQIMESDQNNMQLPLSSHSPEGIKYHGANVVDKLDKFEHALPEALWLSRADYSYNYISEELDGNWSTTMTLSDYLPGTAKSATPQTRAVNTTTHWFHRNPQPYSDWYQVGLRDQTTFTELRSLTTEAGDIWHRTEYEYARLSDASLNAVNQPTPMQQVQISVTELDVIMPAGQSPQAADWIPSAKTTFEYETEYSRSYDNATARDIFGLDVAKKITKQLVPDTEALYLQTRECYRHFPTSTSTVSLTQSYWDEEGAMDAWHGYQASGEQDKYQHPWQIPSYTTDAGPLFPTSPYLRHLTVETTVLDPGNKILQGSRTKYAGDYDIDANGAYLKRPGLPLAGYDIGEDGVEVLGQSFEYGSLEVRNAPIRTENALGVTASNYYAYEEIPGAGYDENNPPKADMLNNADELTARDMSGRLVLMHESPMAQHVTVRGFAPGAGYDSETLETLYERTFLDQVSGTRDPNGAYSSANYDAIGRVKTAWQPFDFPSDDPLVTPYSGSLTMPFFGRSEYSRTTNYQLRGSGTPLDESHPYFTPDAELQETGRENELIAARPWSRIPICTDADGLCDITASATAKGGGDAVQVDSDGKIAFDTEREYQGVINYYPAAQDLLQSAQNINSLEFVLSPQSFAGHDIFLTLEMRHFPAGGGETLLLQETFLFEHYAATPDAGDARLQLDLFDEIANLQNIDGRVEIRIINHTLGSEAAFGNIAEIARPHFVIDGDLLYFNSRADFTAQYSYDDGVDPSTTILAKVDDAEHTESDWDVVGLGFARHQQTKHHFGADSRLQQSVQTIGAPGSPGAVDRSVSFEHSGLGLNLTSFDQLGYSTAQDYDDLGRPVETTNKDMSTRQQAYNLGRPSAVFAELDDADFYGFCRHERDTDEMGYHRDRYYDAFGNLRVEIFDNNPFSQRRHTRYDYDRLGRLLKVRHPDMLPVDHETEYCYDDFGRAKYIKQADMGTTSQAYDLLGNLRFSQTQQQAEDGVLIFNQYDDLNRLVIVGEAQFDVDPDGGPTHGASGGKGRGDQVQSGFAALPTRWTDALDPNVLNNGVGGDPLTVNSTIWIDGTPANPVPAVWNLTELWETSCTPAGFGQLPGQVVLPPAFLRHPANYYERPTPPNALVAQFEDVFAYPEHIRQARHYDELPPAVGVIWSNFPAHSQWDLLAPTGKVRKLKGRLAATAYRQHAGEPFHYEVRSYDERGRIEALLRYTENLGFDAVYYSYNSANQVIAVTDVSPQRQHSTWYGTDHNGRVDKVWSYLGDNGSGFGIAFPVYPAIINPAGDGPAIEYNFTERNEIRSMRYPDADVVVDYTWNARGWASTMGAAHSTQGSLFQQTLHYQPHGQIVKQESWNILQPLTVTQDYTYSEARELTGWDYGDFNGTIHSQTYDYDAFGNRRHFERNNIGAQFSYADPNGPNRITRYEMQSERVDYSFDANGAMTGRDYFYHNGSLWQPGPSESLTFGYTGLVEQFVSTPPGPIFPSCPSATSSNGAIDWRYRYSPTGEREQKRLYYSPDGDKCGNAHPWVYYQLDVKGRQLAVFNGSQTTEVDCNDGSGPQTLSRAVYMYPVEYLTYGNHSNHAIATRPGIGREYKIADHLGSTRLVVNAAGIAQSMMDYEPFGSVVGGGGNERLSFIDKERDFESRLGDFGVRKYDEVTGRFVSTDALWEKYRHWSPYQYSRNNPLLLSDPTGLADFYTEDGQVLSDGVSDGKIYAVPNHINIKWLTNEDGDINYETLADVSFLLPKETIRKMIAEDIDPFIRYGLVQEGGGVVAEDNNGVQYWQYGGAGHELHHSSSNDVHATESVKRALNKANAEGLTPTFVIHNHPYSRSPDPSGPDRKTSLVLKIPGILLHKDVITVFHGESTVQLPRSVIMPFDGDGDRKKFDPDVPARRE